MNKSSIRSQKISKAARKYPGDVETPHFCGGNKSVAEDTNRDGSPVPQTQLPNGKESLKSQTATAKPLGFPTKDVGSFREDVGLGLL